jgi:poly-beta-1,6-N-acetyl-D-glucosamine synthase
MYALITPARNEADGLARLAPTIIGQTLSPNAWVIVDDGSEDATDRVAQELAQQHSWIRLVRAGRERDGLRQGRREGRDLLSLQQGVAALTTPVEFVTKLDADLTLPLDYFERLLKAFDADPRLGIASGTHCEFEDGRWQARHVTGTSLVGACRTYRWECWEQVQPLEPRMGWDGIDEARAIVAGWKTLRLLDLRFRHHRPMGAREGSRFKARAAEGIGAHYMGYRLFYLLTRSFWHARRDPAALGMLWGWLTAFAGRESRCPDPAARAYVRRQQSLRYIVRRFREARGRTA